MSTSQNDKDNIEYRVRKPDEGSEKKLDEIFKASLRDATVENLVKKANELELGKKMQTSWLQHKSHVEANQQRMEVLQNWDEYIDDFDMGYDGTSNIHLPLPMIVLKTFHARMFQALFAVDPPFSVRAMQEAYQDDVDMVYGLMAWTLKEWCNYNEGVEAVADRWLWNWCAFGSAVLKLRWDCRYTRYIDVEDIYLKGPSSYEVIIDPDTGSVQEIEKPSVIRSQRERAVTEKTFEGPCIEFVPKEDIAIIGGKDIQTCDMVIHRTYLTADQLQTEALRKVFDQDLVDEMINGGPHSESGKPGQSIKQDREVTSGIQTLDIPEDQDRYEILECYVEVDVNNDGLNESVILWVDNNSGAVLRATYIHRVLRGGKRPFANIEFIPREGHAYAMGLLELIHPISVELDMIHNIKVDIGIMAAQPIGFYRAATGMDPIKLRIKPGDLIPVDDPGSHVFFPNLGDRSGFFKDEEAILMQHIERLTSINDINTATLGRQGAARTATGVSALVSENSANLDIFIKRMQRGWRQVLRVLWQMLQQRLPDGTEFRITGRDGREYFQRVNRMNIQQRVDFYIEATSANSNRMVQLEQSMQVLAQCMNPLFLQIGIIKPSGIYEALKDYFQHLGKKDYARFIERPQGVTRQLTAEEELARIVAGKKVQITPDMDHEGFAKLAELMLANEEAVSYYGAAGVEAIKAQKSQHEALQKSMEAQAGQIAQANQQQNNAMGVAGGAQSGGKPMLGGGAAEGFSNPYNDFQSARAGLMNSAAGPGGMLPGMQKPAAGGEE